MADHFDLLSRVIDGLKTRTGDLRQIAEATGISYDTVLRIRRIARPGHAAEYDPGYSKVRALADHLGIGATKPTKKRSAEPVKG